MEASDGPAGPQRQAGDQPPFRYDARLAGDIEARWQDRWEAEGTFAAPNPAGPLAEGFSKVAGQPKFMIMDMFPYPSGAGLHVGHPLGYIGTDVYARFLRMTGHNVLHPFGYDAFGLPAEQYAIDTGQHPAATTCGASSRPRTRPTTGGPSGSSCRSSAAGSTSGPARRGRSASWWPSSRRASGSRPARRTRAGCPGLS
jgi:hypothetical protein